MDSRIMLRAAVLGPIGTNVYFVKNTETDEMFIVDPADDAFRIKQAVRSMEGSPAAILLTHGHFDHIMAVKDIKDEYNIPVYACRQEEEVLKSPAANLSAGYGMSISI
ncbi:MAG: MBL fold metallo-hydrolase, partial [Lachnospiraceae bacterium]|nr:MBL fold metallo-hydrolase [Lachnospiraceae bacterium]